MNLKENYTPRELVERLVSFKSTSFNEQELAEWCIEYLKGNGRDPEIEWFNPGEFIEDYDGKKSCNIYLDVGEGGEAILFYAHMDVVKGPERLFSPEERNGRLYGRGTADMKTALAAMLYIAANRDFDKRVIFHFVSDEESSGTGARKAVTNLEGKKLEKLECLLMEPTDNFGFIEREAKGYAFCRVKGRFERLWDIVSELDQLEYDFSHPKLGKNIVTPTKIVPESRPCKEELKVIKGDSCHASRSEEGLNPILKLNNEKNVKLAWTPDNSRNTLADEVFFLEGFPSDELATLYIDVRTLPGMHEEVISKVERLTEDLELEIDDSGPSYSIEDDSHLLQVCSKVCPDARLESSRGASDATHYSQVADTVIGGFGPGLKELIHTEEEFIHTEQIPRTIEIVQSIIENY